MNNRIQTYPPKRVIFRHWTRKSYAVFNSLNKEINIGHLNFEIGDRTFSKCSGTSFSHLQLYVEEEVEAEELEETEILEVCLSTPLPASPCPKAPP